MDFIDKTVADLEAEVYRLRESAEHWKGVAAGQAQENERLKAQIANTPCRHPRRRPYDTGWSVGDVSDIESKCMDCGRLLRDPANV